MPATLPLTPHQETDIDLMPLISQYQLMPQFRRGLILDNAIATLECTEAEQAQFCEQHGLQEEITRQSWLQQQGMTPEQFAAWTRRELKIRKFQQAQWGHSLKSYFLERKGQLDQVVCSLIHVQDSAVAQELYFRIAEGEQSFAEAARLYSQGPESYANGIVGPIALGNLHPALSRLFYGGQPGVLHEPMQIGEWVVIGRLEVSLPVQFDEAMQQYLLNELLESWLQEQLVKQFS